LQTAPNPSPSISLIFSGAFGAVKKKPVKKNILLFVPYIVIIFIVFFTQAFQFADKGEANGRPWELLYVGEKEQFWKKYEYGRRGNNEISLWYI